MNDNRPFVAPLIIVMLATLIAALLLTAAFTTWLAGYFGSIVFPCIIAGGAWAALAVIVYRISLRDTIRLIGSHLNTVYEVSHALKECYEWVARWLHRG